MAIIYELALNFSVVVFGPGLAVSAFRI